MTALDLSSFEPYFRSGKNFEMTEEQYVENIRRKLPETISGCTKSPRFWLQIAGRRTHPQGANIYKGRIKNETVCCNVFDIDRMHFFMCMRKQ